jgi:flavin-dependent dehydrogenase
LSSSGTCDVAVIGSGPAGCATALALRRQGIDRICIIDAGRRLGVHIGETLLPDTHLVLEELGVWDRFVDESHEPCLGSCSSWGNETLGYNDFLLSPYGKGWHLDRQRFDAFLLSCAKSQRATVFCDARVVGYEHDGQKRVRLRLKADIGALPVLTARFVVDATGSRSAFARWVGAEPGFLDRLTLVYGFFDASAGSSASRLTMLEATEAGWWYAAALPGRRLAVAFATDPDIILRDRLSCEDRWLASVLRTLHIAPRLDGSRYLRGSLAIRVAPSFLLDHVAGARWLAVGDAAAAYDPLSSQGIQKALANGVKAGKAIAAALAHDTEISSAYAASVAADFENYRINRNYFYGIETRWTESVFWQRRHERAALQWPAPI